jgi:hypothetical protein
MRNLLALAGLVVVGFAGLGWYLGWYKIQSSPSSDGHTHIQIDLNTNKIKSDVVKGENAVHEVIANKENTGPQNSNGNVPANGTTGLRQTEDDTFVFPGDTPPPPSGSPTLPTPR